MCPVFVKHLWISTTCLWMALCVSGRIYAQQTPPSSPQTLTIERIFASPSLAGPSLRALKVSPAGDRVTFLRGKDEDREQLDLWEYHIGDASLRTLVDSTQLVAREVELSTEEKARRERQRIAGLKGIVDYRWSRDGRFLLFPLNGDVYLYDTQASGNTQVSGDQQAESDQAIRQITRTEAFETDPQVSPDGAWVAYVRDQNLYVTQIASGSEKQLTHDGGGVIKNAMAEFIAQEEMDRQTGFWWSPDSQSIAFLRVDESPVPVTKRYEIEADDIHIIEQRYPYAGADNAHLRLGVIELGSGKTTWLDTGDNLDIYIPRVKWLPDSRHLSFQRQSRDQQQLELIIADPEGQNQQTIINEKSETWVALHNDLYFLKQQNAFIWSSERSGYRHLYLYDMDGHVIRPLTQGDWQVDKLTGVDEQNGQVYFTASKESPVEKHLYRQALNTQDPTTVKRMTTGQGMHEIEMDEGGQIFISRYSNRDQPPQIGLYNQHGQRLTWLIENAMDDQHPYTPFYAAHQPTRFGSLDAVDGQALHYRMTLPLGFDESQRYPVFYYIYGGPTSQTVTNRWDRRILFEQYMAQQGFIVFSLDNRGTPRRGMAFQAPAFHHLGAIEVEDYRTGIEYLRRQKYVDARRIGMFGWSYGGYITLMSLLKDADSYAMGVAVAPVTDWRLYDTHYTERYLGKPRDQTEAYATGNVLNYTGQLQDPLLVIHGMADDNVLFSHTTQLYREFQNQGILFDTMPYPGAKHGISGQAAQTHVYRTISEYFKKQLLSSVE